MKRTGDSTSDDVFSMMSCLYVLFMVKLSSSGVCLTNVTSEIARALAMCSKGPSPDTLLATTAFVEGVFRVYPYMRLCADFFSP